MLQANGRPQDIKQLKSLIARRVVVLSDQQELVTRLVLSNPEIIAFGSANRLAAACQVSPSTVARVVHAFGFDAFRDFRELFRRHLKFAER